MSTGDGEPVTILVPWYSYYWAVYARMFMVAMPWAVLLLIARSLWRFLGPGLVASRPKVTSRAPRFCTGILKEAAIILPVTLYGLVFKGAQSLSLDTAMAIWAYFAFCSVGAGVTAGAWMIRGAARPRRLAILAWAGLWAVLSVGAISGFRATYFSPPLLGAVIRVLNWIQ